MQKDLSQKYFVQAGWLVGLPIFDHILMVEMGAFLA
jgi:hypothetical protein